MGILDSFGALVSSIIAAIVMLAFAILSFFVTVFIVDAGAGLAGVSPGAAIVAGATPMTSLAGTA